jgi:hypothetical protein
MFAGPVLAQDPVARGLAASRAPLDAYGAVPPANLANAQPRPRLICSGGGASSNTNATPGQQAQFAFEAWCPHGGSQFQFMFPGYANNTSPTRLTYPVPMNLSVRIVHATWDPTVTYTAGQIVRWQSTPSNFTGAGSNNPEFQAVATNTNSMPSTDNANWTAAPVVTPTRISCGGNIYACGLTTITSPAGVVSTQGYFLTDPVNPGTCPSSGCFLEVLGYIAQTGSQVYPIAELPQPRFRGAYLASASSLTDLTATGAASVTISSASNVGMRPIAVLGQGYDGPSVCVAGDSIATGYVGGGLGSSTIVNAGTGYQNGDIVTPNGANASSGAIATPGTIIVGSQTGGVPSQLITATTGSYTNPATIPNQTLPSGTQATTGGHGTGLTVTTTFTTSGNDTGDLEGGKGFLQRGLDAKGIPWASISVSGDRAANWNLTDDYGRYDMMRVIGCHSLAAQLSINDVTFGSTAVQIEGWLNNIASNFLARGGLAAYLFETIPFPTSTDGYLTLGNQTVNATYDPVRQALNTWKNGAALIANGGLFTYTFPLNAVAESSPGSGKTAVDGVTVCPILCDGKHPSINGHIVQSAVISANAAQLK